MGQKRLINSDVLRTAELIDTGWLEKLLFIAMLLEADDEGCVCCEPSYLKGVVQGPWRGVKMGRVDDLVSRLRDQDVVRLYEVNGRKHLQFLAWDKHQKLAMLIQHYTLRTDGTPATRPNWSDAIPVDGVYDLCGRVWEFRPATFLDDLADNWMDDGRPGVTLGEEEKERLMQLPWVPDWLNSVFVSRERKRARESAAAQWRDTTEEHIPHVPSPGPIS